ncbi:hypothetical protein ABZX40_29870 [Streptomyces sp. NPDC004610]|uniref:hypothetical protein n=1 Tax=unclassified Streptomyces TaxID=2593676 RepID=UPI0033B484FE
MRSLGVTLGQYLAGTADALEGDAPAIGREGVADARPFVSPTGDGLRWLEYDVPDIIADHYGDGWRPV